jgi:molecular chaperone HscA
VIADPQRPPCSLRRVLDKPSVILVGDSTRSPVVRAHVEQLFGRAPLCDLDPDLVVASGAAVQADVLASGRKDGVLAVTVREGSIGSA